MSTPYLYGAHNSQNDNPYFLGKSLLGPNGRPGPYEGLISQTDGEYYRTLDIHGNSLLTAAMIYDPTNESSSFVLQTLFDTTGWAPREE